MAAFLNDTGPERMCQCHKPAINKRIKKKIQHNSIHFQTRKNYEIVLSCTNIRNDVTKPLPYCHNGLPLEH